MAENNAVTKKNNGGGVLSTAFKAAVGTGVVLGAVAFGIGMYIGDVPDITVAGGLIAAFSAGVGFDRLFAANKINKLRDLSTSLKAENAELKAQIPPPPEA